MIGTTFERLTVIAAVASTGKTLWLCRCQCGEEKTVRADHLRAGRTRSCGCLSSTATAARNVEATKHGHSVGGVSPTYRSWQSMRTRCLNPNSDQWPDYGGRGISICERWSSFENFLADMGERLPGMSIDRWPNHNGNYEPGNCRWATMSQQENNKRGNVTINYGGETLTVAEWAKRTGIGYQTLRKRLAAGWAPERILTAGTCATSRRVPRQSR